MSVEQKRLAGVFFIPRGRDLSIEELLRKAGAEDISAPSVSSDPSGLLDCKWAGMYCKASLDSLSKHQVLQIYFWQSSFLALLNEESADIPLERDGALPLALSFRDACEALSPEVAFLVTHQWQANRDVVLSREWKVLTKDANELANERFGLLYLDEDIGQYWTYIPRLDNRDSLPVSKGLLVFAGQGSSRWY
jgi:hypothetical protein